MPNFLNPARLRPDITWWRKLKNKTGTQTANCLGFACGHEDTMVQG